MESILIFLLIGLIAGFLAGRIMKGSGFGILGNIVIGCIGAVFGGWLLTLLNISYRGLLAEIIAAVIGAIVLILLLRLVKK